MKVLVIILVMIFITVSLYSDFLSYTFLFNFSYSPNWNIYYGVNEWEYENLEGNW